MRSFRQNKTFWLAACAVAALAVASLFDCKPRSTPVGAGSAAGVPNSPIHFTDIAALSGIRYQFAFEGKRPGNVLQTIGNGCAFLDFDGDGNLDVLLVGPKLALYRGDGKGHFTDVTHETGLDRFTGHYLGCAVGDYDGDGYDDIYISGYGCGLLLHNEGGKRFTDATAASGLKPQPWGTSCTWVETVPGSGTLDLFVCNYLDFGPDPKRYQQLCDVNGHPTACGPRYYGALRDVLFRNDGKGHFIAADAHAFTVSGKGLGVTCAPLDDTRAPFIAVADDEEPGDLLRPTVANRQTTYTNIATAAGTATDRDGDIHGGMGTDWGDYDNDGKLDLFVGAFQHETKPLYHNDGNLLFSDASFRVGLAGPTSPNVAFGSKLFDADNDGWLDLAVANGHIEDNIQDIDPTTTYAQPTQFFHNVNGKFTDLSAAVGPDLHRPIVGRGLAIGDFDNDGKIDMLVVDSEGAPLLLHNESSGTGHFLSLKLVGTKSNRDGYGALVTVTAPGLPTQTRLCHADGSYLSSSDRRVHVGLGSAMKAATVKIVWPSGTVDTLTDVAGGQTVTVREGQGGQKGK